MCSERSEGVYTTLVEICIILVTIAFFIVLLCHWRKSLNTTNDFRQIEKEPFLDQFAYQNCLLFVGMFYEEFISEILVFISYMLIAKHQVHP